MTPVCPVLGNVHGLGWGPLTLRSHKVVRLLSGADDAMIFIPPVVGKGYTVTIDFPKDTDRETLLSLKVEANRRDPIERVLSFGEDGSKLSVTIDASISDFGMGWVALRLYVGEGKFGIMFGERPTSVEMSSDIAVKGIEIRSLELGATCEAAPSRSPLTIPRAKGGGPGREASLPTVFHCVVPVWGKQYLETYLAVGLPAHLSDGNLAALQGQIIYEIYTDEIGRETIQKHPLYPTLRKVVDEVIFLDIREFRYDERAYHSFHNLVLNYTVMNICHQTAIARATAHGGALLFLNCDTVYSDGVFANFRELCLEGYRVIENLRHQDRPGPDAACPCPELQARRHSQHFVIRFDENCSFEAALDRQSQFWNGRPGLTTPNNIHWWVAEDAILLRSTHFMPVYVFPRAQEVQFSGTIDHGIVPAAGVHESERWLMASEAEPSLAYGRAPRRHPPGGHEHLDDHQRHRGRGCSAWTSPTPRTPGSTTTGCRARRRTTSSRNTCCVAPTSSPRGRAAG